MPMDEERQAQYIVVYLPKVHMKGVCTVPGTSPVNFARYSGGVGSSSRPMCRSYMYGPAGLLCSHTSILTDIKRPRPCLLAYATGREGIADYEPPIQPLQCPTIPILMISRGDDPLP